MFFDGDDDDNDDDDDFENAIETAASSIDIDEMLREWAEENKEMYDGKGHWLIPS